MIFTIPSTELMSHEKDETGFWHEPILRDQVVELLGAGPGRLIVDGTLGGGGHSEAFLRAGARVIGIDQDPEAIAAASERLAEFGERFTAVRGNYAELDSIMDELDIDQIDGAFLDIGVSSWQLDSAQRGFSFMKNGPLDMRMNPDAVRSAADLLNVAERDELAEILWKYGEEKASRRLASQFVSDREKRPFKTTFDLVESIERVLPRRGKSHPATRTFQALRIAVNCELEVLEIALEAFSRRLAPGGRLAVLTFHSLEDRIVKRFFRHRSRKWLDRPEWPGPVPNPDHIFKSVTSRPLTPNMEEQRRNPRSRSAKLRIVEKTYHGTQS
jgi:16S rRNA (cytosine1402-N4)-methyltransferase